jgi:transglutaminase/protease-like cytokinesis protein 3
LIHTAYGALIQGDAVCDGYAEAFKYLLDKLDIENVLIFGEGNEEGEFIGEINHAWNLVMVDGQYRHFDVTWNDDDVNQRVRYTFYNQDNEFMDDTHQWDMEYYSKYLE